MNNERLIDDIYTELDKQTSAGISSGNIDRVHKLLCMLDAIRDIEHHEAETKEIMLRINPDMVSNYDEDTYDRLMKAKRDYRADHNSTTKRNLISKLEAYMDDLTTGLEEMLRDSDFAEERETIQRYISKMRAY